jgi:hypothetical protein
MTIPKNFYESMNTEGGRRQAQADARISARRLLPDDPAGIRIHGRTSAKMRALSRLPHAQPLANPSKIQKLISQKLRFSRALLCPMLPS